MAKPNDVWFIDLKINGVKGHGLLDTGADTSVIRKKFITLDAINLESLESIGGDGEGSSVYSSIGVTQLRIYTSTASQIFNFYVYEDDHLPYDFVICNTHIWDLVDIGLPLYPDVPKNYIAENDPSSEIFISPKTYWTYSINVINSRQSGISRVVLDTGSNVNIISNDLLECGDKESNHFACWTGKEISNASVVIRVFNSKGSIIIKAYARQAPYSLLLSNESIWDLYRKNAIVIPIDEIEEPEPLTLEILSFQISPELNRSGSSIPHRNLIKINPLPILTHSNLNQIKLLINLGSIPKLILEDILDDPKTDLNLNNTSEIVGWLLANIGKKKIFDKFLRDKTISKS